MSLVNEAGYLYVQAKKLSSLNKQLKRLSKKVSKQVKKHGKAKTAEKRHKHKKKHEKAVLEVRKLMKEHNQLLEKLKHHQTAFAHSLQKEHQS